MKTSTKKKCEAYAAQHFITITVRRFSGVWYSVDLPEGLITESGNTGKGGEVDDWEDVSMAEIWGAIMDDMKTLVWEKWIVNPDCNLEVAS
jgi:hypothetical protein